MLTKVNYEPLATIQKYKRFFTPLCRTVMNNSKNLDPDPQTALYSTIVLFVSFNIKYFVARVATSVQLLREAPLARTNRAAIQAHHGLIAASAHHIPVCEVGAAQGGKDAAQEGKCKATPEETNRVAP
jgi:hypothetical protein